MIDLIEQNKPALIALCRQFGVKRLDLFGSAAKGTFMPGKSDIDFVVEFFDYGPGITDRLLGFMHAAENLFGVPVDLVSARKISNPYLRHTINLSRKRLYDATEHRQTAA